MKLLISALLLISSSAFALEMDATEALLSTLPAGEYQGLAPGGKRCEVSVEDLNDRVVISARSPGKIQKTEVLRGATYRWNPGPRSFFSSVITGSQDHTTESLIRTIAVESQTQYVVVAEINRSSSRDNSETKVECVIEL